MYVFFDWLNTPEPMKSMMKRDAILFGTLEFLCEMMLVVVIIGSISA